MNYLKVNNRFLRSINGKNIDKVNGTRLSGGIIESGNISSYTYLTGTLPAEVQSLTCYRASSPYAQATTGVIANGGTLYYGDIIYFSVVPITGYAVTVVHNSSNPLTVYRSVNGVNDAQITPSLLSYTYTRGTLPAGITSLTCYRSSSPTGAVLGEISDGATIYYGDTLYWNLTYNSTAYNTPSFSYYDSSHTLTVDGDVTGIVVINLSISVKQFTYTVSSLPTGCASLTCYRASSPYEGAATTTISSGDIIYYGDELYWSAIATTGYSVSVHYDSSSNTKTVTGNITITESGGGDWIVSVAKLSYTYYTGTLPTGIASLTCYNQNGTVVPNGGTIYYGDSFYFSYTLSANYHIVNNTYYNSSHRSPATTGNITSGATLTGISAAINRGIIRIKNSTGYTVTLTGGTTISNGGTVDLYYDYGINVGSINADTGYASSSYSFGTVTPSSNNQVVANKNLTQSSYQKYGSVTTTTYSIAAGVSDSFQCDTSMLIGWTSYMGNNYQEWYAASRNQATVNISSANAANCFVTVTGSGSRVGRYSIGYRYRDGIGYNLTWNDA